MITEETYNEMKRLISVFESKQEVDIKNEPYIKKYTVDLQTYYNKDYGDDRICQCGHPYYRHFDTYEQMDSCGCKYCSCWDFVEQTVKTK